MPLITMYFLFLVTKCLNYGLIVFLFIFQLFNYIYIATAGLSNIQGLSIASNPESPIVFLKLDKSIGSVKDDLKVLEDIADRVRD